MAVAVAIAVAGFGFASCSDDDDEDNGPAVVASFTEQTEEDPVTITFYADSTFAFAGDGRTYATGTYTGKPAEAGEVVATTKKIAKSFFDGGSDFTMIDVPSELDDEMKAYLNRTFTIKADGTATDTTDTTWKKN